MARILIKNGELVNPYGVSGIMDITVSDGKVELIGAQSGTYDTVIDASGMKIFPGFVDMHVHLREPGFEYKEDIATGAFAAAKGGFTAVACMPNTKPVLDNEAGVRYVIERSKMARGAKVYPIAAVTVGQKGEEITEMGLLKEAGAVAFSDDGCPVADAQIMRLALLYGQSCGALIISHCEEKSLINGGVMNEGNVATEIGLKGISHAVEEVMVARDLVLQETYGGRLHLAHMSTKGSMQLIREAKKRGVKVTAETCPHYFAASDEWVRGYDTNTKVNPPLRSKEDVEAVKAAIADGTIDVIATDHAPHHADEKNVEYDAAINGLIGVETAFALTCDLVREGVIGYSDMVRLMSRNPAKRLGIKGGAILEGEAADLVIADPDEEFTYTMKDVASKGKNSPFIGKKLKGRVKMTFVDGEMVFDDNAWRKLRW